MGLSELEIKGIKLKAIVKQAIRELEDEQKPKDDGFGGLLMTEPIDLGPTKDYMNHGWVDFKPVD